VIVAPLLKSTISNLLMTSIVQRISSQAMFLKLPLQLQFTQEASHQQSFHPSSANQLKPLMSFTIVTNNPESISQMIPTMSKIALDHL